MFVAVDEWIMIVPKGFFKNRGTISRNMSGSLPILHSQLIMIQQFEDRSPSDSLSHRFGLYFKVSSEVQRSTGALEVGLPVESTADICQVRDSFHLLIHCQMLEWQMTVKYLALGAFFCRLISIFQ